jgi:heme-degrading monooxygenase HmoA
VVQQTFQPAAKGQPGFRGFMLLADRATHQLTGITLWETEADRAASAGAGGYYQDQMENFAGLLTAPATTTTHEVAAFET